MTTIHCPLCDWTHTPESEQYAASNLAAAPAVANALGMPAGALLSIHAHQAAKRDEATIKQHMLTHTPQEWLPELMRTRAAVARVRELVDDVDNWSGYESRDTGSVYLAESVHDLIGDIRRALDEEGV